MFQIQHEHGPHNSEDRGQHIDAHDHIQSQRLHYILVLPNNTNSIFVHRELGIITIRLLIIKKKQSEIC